MHRHLAQEVAVFENIGAVPRLLDVICHITGMRFAAVARVTDQRWVACRVVDLIAFGVEPGDELDIATTLCREVRLCSEPVIIEHVDNDPQYRDHHTPRIYGFQSYVSMPIFLPDGSFYGTLCALDLEPRPVKQPHIVETFRLFSELIWMHLDGHERLVETEANLLGERETAKLREEFIAVLGHDLRNPLASIKAGTSALLRSAADQRTTTIAQLMLNSIARMESMISNVLDFARGRLGSGLAIQPEAKPIEFTVTQVIDELHASAPAHTFETSITVDQPVRCDHDKIAQLLSNLVGNAISHGDEAEPIRVHAALDHDALILSVSNAGDPVPDAVKSQLFQPFYRREHRTSRQGLGLGLYISAEIARAHGGSLEVESSSQRTIFTLRIPNVLDEIGSAK